VLATRPYDWTFDLSQADDIRTFTFENWIKPARDKAAPEVTIRAGDVHKGMNLSNAYPAVCNAIGGDLFANLAKVKLLEKTGPAEGANVFFRYALDGGSALTIDEARAELQRRYGQPVPARGKYVTAFALPNGRELALEEQGAKVQIWMENVDGSTPPSVDEIVFYEPEQGRNSNLPNRLAHNPSATVRAEGFPRPVIKVLLQTPAALARTLDWYEGIGTMFDRKALEILKTRFLERYKDFPKLTFTSSQGSYWDDERGYKQTMLDRVHKDMGTQPPWSDIELGRRLLATLIDKPSNLLDWRTQGRLAEIRTAHPDVIENASGKLAHSTEAPAQAVAHFVNEVWPLFAEGHDESLPYGDIRDISTMVLALAKPDQAIAARYQRMHNAGVALLHHSIFRNQPLSEGEYADVLGMAQKIFDVMRDEWRWAPRDLWDVQGFIWVTCKERIESGSVEERAIDMTKNADVVTPTTNLIFYGPPGTGKTYLTAKKAVELCDGAIPPGGRAELMARYRELVDRKRIEFVTFHQSYSYEDFIEGLRPETGAVDDGDEDAIAGFRLVPRPGVFQAIADRAASNRGAAASAPINLEDRQVFKMSLGRSTNDADAYLFDEAIAGNCVMLAYGGEIDWSDPAFERFDAIKERWQKIDPEAKGNDPNVQQIYALRSWMKKGDLVVVSDGNRRFRAIGEVTGPYRYVQRERDAYHHQRAVNWLWVEADGLPREEIYNKSFSQVSIYRLNSEHLKLPALAQIVSAGKLSSGAGKPEPYVLVIDEINRANISKVFGEIITLIEPDKRLGMENAITLTLPYSGRSFGVPANLHVVGTMNTADRSIALLDTALRRRFHFQELMPEADLLKENIEGINLRAVLRGLNDRIEYLFDRDHQIGHGYFLGCTKRAELEIVMRDKVIPLLIEYFYENWEKVRAVLNETQNDGAFITRKLIAPPQNSNESWDADGERWRYSVNASFSPEAFAQLE